MLRKYIQMFCHSMQIDVFKCFPATNHLIPYYVPKYNTGVIARQVTQTRKERQKLVANGFPLDPIMVAICKYASMQVCKQTNKQTNTQTNKEVTDKKNSVKKLVANGFPLLAILVANCYSNYRFGYIQIFCQTMRICSNVCQTQTNQFHIPKKYRSYRLKDSLCMPSWWPIVPLTNLIVQRIGVYGQEQGWGGNKDVGDHNKRLQTLFMILVRLQHGY